MAGNTVQMDYGVIGEVSKDFGTASDVLTTVGKALEVAIGILRATALFSLGTGLALAQYLDTIKDKVEKLATLCTTFGKRLAAAISDHQKGDVAGKSYFTGNRSG